jgi:hypothetical protein
MLLYFESMKSVIKILIGILFLIILAECKKDKNEVIQNGNPFYDPKQKCYLVKQYLYSVYETNKNILRYYEFVYDANFNLLKRNYCVAYKSDSSNNRSPLIRYIYDSIVYDSNSFPIKVINYERGIYIENFIYEDKKLTQINYEAYLSKNDTQKYLSGFEKLYYDKTGLLIKNYELLKSGSKYDEVLKTTIYEYSYIDKNISRIDVSYQAKTNSLLPILEDTIVHFSFATYTDYDDLNNPFKHLFILRDYRTLSLSKNNYHRYYSKTEKSESNLNYSKENSSNTISNYPNYYFISKLEYNCK